VHPEDAEANDIGPTIISAPSLHQGYVDVELRAVVRDITAVGESPFWDEFPGNIGKATVSFLDAASGDLLCGPADTRYVFEGNQQVGLATCVARLELPTGADEASFEVGLEVGGWYTNSRSAANPTTVIVKRPAGDFLTGSGLLLLAEPAGTLAPGNVTDLTLNVRWGMPGFHSLTGEARLRFDSDGRSYEVETTSFDLLGVMGESGGNHGIAHLEARATLRDRTGPGQGTVVATNLRLQLRVTDHGSTADVSFALWADDGTLIAASGWDADHVPEIPHAGGNSQVHIS
jgi:hypothetical protein